MFYTWSGIFGHTLLKRDCICCTTPGASPGWLVPGMVSESSVSLDWWKAPVSELLEQGEDFPWDDHKNYVSGCAVPLLNYVCLASAELLPLRQFRHSWIVWTRSICYYLLLFYLKLPLLCQGVGDGRCAGPRCARWRHPPARLTSSSSAWFGWVSGLFLLIEILFPFPN